jgi:hypothetical protein
MPLAGGSPRYRVTAVCGPVGRWAKEVRSMSATATKVTVDREVLERFMLEVQALACFEQIRFGCEPLGDSPVSDIIYQALDEFERTSGTRDMDDEEEGMRLHDQAWARARELHRELLETMLSEAVAS